MTLLFTKLCYAFEEKPYKKVTLSCLKMNLKISHKGILKNKNRFLIYATFKLVQPPF